MGAQSLETNAEKGSLWVAGTGFLGALAVILPPGPTGQPNEIAAVLVVGALAMAAGHRWGLLVVVIADAMLVGRMWPVLAFPDAQSTQAVATATLALLGAVPGVVLLRRTLPRVVETMLGTPSHRLRSTVLAGASLLLVVWVVLPAF